MTKPKNEAPPDAEAATTPAQAKAEPVEQVVLEQVVLEQPAAGGSYIRQGDGSLKRVED